MTLPLFIENLEFITAVTKALNGLPTGKDFYVHVELRSEGSHEVVGQWCDEIAGDAWYFAAKGDGA
jgi:hypothetical protein